MLTDTAAGRRMNPRVLVGFIHINERSVPAARAGIELQEQVDTQIFEVAGLAKWEAHEQLFRTFTDRTAEFDLLVKVDGDMEIMEPRLFAVLAAFLDLHPDVDLISVGVDDWFSGEKIHGMVAWRGGVRWTEPPPELLTDLAENTVRNSFKVLDAGRTLVIHGRHPTVSQAARYGAHRALKAVATGKAHRVERTLGFVRSAAAHPDHLRFVAVAAVLLGLTDNVTARRLTSGSLTDADRTLLEELSARPSLIPEMLAELCALAERFSNESASASQRPRLRSRLHALAGRPLESQLVRRFLHRSAHAQERDRDAQRAAFMQLLEENDRTT